MTKWYSPKDKLPPIAENQIGDEEDDEGKYLRPTTSTEVIGWYKNKGAYEPPLEIIRCDEDGYWYLTRIPIMQISSGIAEIPDLWCYFPQPPQELIDKLKEK